MRISNLNNFKIFKIVSFSLLSIYLIFSSVSCSQIPISAPTPSPRSTTSTYTQIATSIPPTSTFTPTVTRTLESTVAPDYDFSKIPGYLAVSDFSCKDSINYCMNLLLYSPNLKGGKRLTNHKDGIVVLMRWSPDSRYIAYVIFVAGETGGYQLRLYDFKTQQTTLLTTKFIPDVTSISWSPDCRHLAVGYQDGKIQIMDVVTHILTTLVNDTKMTDIYLAWSPDGDTIAYSSYNNSNGKISSGLYLVSRTGGDPVPVEPSGFLPAWSPDGKQLAYFCHQNKNETSFCVEDIRFDGTSSVIYKLFNLPDTDTFISPVWSPNGLFISLFAGTKDQIKADVVDLSNKIIISTQKERGPYDQPSWSPDSKALVYMDGNGGSSYTIYLVVFDGEKSFTFNNKVRFSDVIWSPSAKLP